ncbi:MAG: hypothetical protein AAF901_13950, partial [Bacteroidota bacterium]
FLDRCLALYADVKRIRGGFFKIQLQMELRDCRGNLVMQTGVGRTKEKDLKKAYNIAIRQAFESISALEYNYTGKENQKKGKTLEAVKASEDVKEAEDALTKSMKETEGQTPEPREATQKETEKIVEDVKSKTGSKLETAAVAQDILYAQPIEDGFQLVDTEPKKVMVLLKTAAKDVYMVKGREAVVFRRDDGTWIYSEGGGADNTEKVIYIKF